MKKARSLILGGILIFLLIRLIFYPTIITIPGRWIIYPYLGKVDFPLCIVNPIVANKIKKQVDEYVVEHIDDALIGDPNDVYTSSSYYKQQSFKWWFKDRIGKTPKYTVSAISKIPSISKKKDYYVLLKAKDDKDIRCVIVVDKHYEVELVSCQESYCDSQ